MIEWYVHRVSPTISDWFPRGSGEHVVGPRCPCGPRKTPIHEGPHVTGVRVVHQTA